MYRPSKERSRRIAAFWVWFGRMAGIFVELDPSCEQRLNDLGEALNHIRDGLTFELGPRVNGRRTFAVSADGAAELFPYVEEVVALAPSLEQWTIRAFRAPKDLCEDDSMQVGDTSVSVSDLCFCISETPDTRVLEVFVSNHDDCDVNRLGPPVFILVDNALGEYVAATQFHSILVRFHHELPVARDCARFVTLPLLLWTPPTSGPAN